MEIIVKVGGRWKKNENIKSLFGIYELHAHYRMGIMAEELGFKPPDSMRLEPFYYRNKSPGIHGRAIWAPSSGFKIVMCAPQCLEMPDMGIWVLDHEIAHIISAIMHNDWEHGENFAKIYANCRKEEAHGLSL